MQNLMDHLQKLNESDEYPFHMPGHKRNYHMAGLSAAYDIDITEIEGYDNLYEADGILKEAMDRAARVYGTDETFFLVNGSTVGILSAVTAVTKRGDRILVARNCHKSVFHAIELRELRAVYLHPEYLPEWEIRGKISAEEVEDRLARFSDIKAVVLTSPTYEGIVSDIEKIADLVHKKNIPLIVDEAHGAHFPFDGRFPKTAIRCGADIVIQSMHKTLPSFTQTALLHMNKGYIDTNLVKEYIGYYQTSSPSYLFMAGMDQCIARIEEKGSSLWDEFFRIRNTFMRKAEELTHIRIFQENDPCKLVISVKNTDMTGIELAGILLEKYHIQMEMTAESYVLGIITMCDKEEGLIRLADALLEIDCMISARTQGSPSKKRNTAGDETEWITNPILMEEEIRYSLSEVREADKKFVFLSEAEGKICASYINLYPPGIPLLLPGERVKTSHVEILERYIKKCMHVQGLQGNQLEICIEKEI